MIKIAGAGISGLSAGIVLAERGFPVQIFEARAEVGSFFSKDVHSLRNYLYDEDILDQYKNFGFSVPPAYPIYNQIRFAPDLKKIRIFSDHKPLFYNFFRGNIGINSLDKHFYSLALEKKVKFFFGVPAKDNEVDIIATGAPKAMIGGYGRHYRNVKNLEPHTNYVFWEDDYAPKGYIYITPYEDEASVAVVSFQPEEIPGLEKKFNNLITNHPIVKDLLEGAEPENIISGFAHYSNSIQLRTKGQLRTGEAGGFLDAATGFGVHYAIISGYLAANIIAEKNAFSLEQEIRSELRRQHAKRRKIEKMRNNDYNDAVSNLQLKFKKGISIEEYRMMHEDE